MGGWGEGELVRSRCFTTRSNHSSFLFLLTLELGKSQPASASQRIRERERERERGAGVHLTYTGYATSLSLSLSLSLTLSRVQEPPDTPESNKGRDSPRFNELRAAAPPPSAHIFLFLLCSRGNLFVLPLFPGAAPVACVSRTSASPTAGPECRRAS
jgi:hypothetical protein